MKPVIFGCRTGHFTDDQLAVLAEHQPFGMILFAEPFKLGPDAVRHVIAQVTKVCPQLKCLIDLEGGPVNRMKPEFGFGWRAVPAARDFAALAERDLDLACEAIKLNAQMIGHDLAALGITIDCAPVVDLVSHEAIVVKGDDTKPHATSASLYRRSFGHDSHIVTECARAFADGLLDRGVVPVLKHAPGYGRVAIDPHYGVDKIRVARSDLLQTDLVPYKNLRDLPAIMTAHTVYSDIDPRPATVSPVMMQIMRDEVGFKNVIIADSIEMNGIDPAGFSTTEFDQFGIGLPLPGTLTRVTQQVLAAGCDLVLHSDCSRDFAHTVEVLEAAPVFIAERASWLLNIMSAPDAAADFNYAAAQQRLQDILTA